MVKRATSLFNSFCSTVEQQGDVFVARFTVALPPSCLLYPKPMLCLKLSSLSSSTNNIDWRVGVKLLSSIWDILKSEILKPRMPRGWSTDQEKLGTATNVFWGYLLKILVYGREKNTTTDNGMKFCRSLHSVHLLILKPPHTAWPLFHGKYVSRMSSFQAIRLRLGIFDKRFQIRTLCCVFQLTDFKILLIFLSDSHWQLHAHYYPPLLRSATVS